MEWTGKWIGPAQSMGDVCPVFAREFNKGDFPGKEVESVQLQVTALGVYEAQLNGKRIGDYVLAPGWTSYETRHQYQCYDITELVEDRNRLEITVGKGWYRSPVPGWITEEGKAQRAAIPAGLIAEIKITFTDTTTAVIPTDETWQAAESRIRFSEIYDGEVYDASFEVSDYQPVVLLERTTGNLIPQQGEKITEHEYVKAARCFTAPNGEVVVDFGQEVTGYIQFTVDAKAGEKVEISHGEVLDKDGNFYNANYRSAKSKIYYTCCDGVQTYKPKMTFFGFRYIRLDQFPGTPCADQFYAVAVHSDMKRTGRLRSSNPLLNQLFSNIIWGQKGNFLDVPTDCPQRDERMGWTGDAQAFVKTASYNFDVDRFFTKWLADMAADQRPDGSIGHVVPTLYVGSGSAAWDDAGAICPWQIYLTYGDKEILRQQFDCMKKYIGFITNSTKDPYLWTGGEHYEDWLGLDAPVGSYKGSSRADFIASAFYAYSTSLVVKAGRVLGEDISEYERLYQGIVDTFRKTFTLPDADRACSCRAFRACRGSSENRRCVGGDDKSLRKQAADRFCGNPLSASRTEQLRTYGACLYLAFAHGISFLALSCYKRGHYRLGALGRHHGKRGLLEHGYELLQSLRIRRGSRLGIRGGGRNSDGGGCAGLCQGKNSPPARQQAGLAGSFH